MTLRLPLANKQHANIISAYAPTLTKEVKERFYKDLDKLIRSVPWHEKLFVLGDFNARVGTDHTIWEAVLGNNGVGKCNSIGLLLQRTRAENDLLINNTVFRLPHRNKTSWMNPRSRHWHLIDFVTTRRTERQQVRVIETSDVRDSDVVAAFSDCDVIY